MGAPEGEIAEALQRTGRLFLRFHRTTALGEAMEQRIVEENRELVTSVRALGELLTRPSPPLRFGGNPPRLQDAMALAGRGLTLTARKMARLVQAVPTFEQSDHLHPLKPPHERLNEVGRKLIAAASNMEEADLLLEEGTKRDPHLVALEERLDHQFRELAQMALETRELIGIAIVELSLSVRSDKH